MQPTEAPVRATASRGRIIAAFAAVYLIWGSTYLGIRFAIETIPPFLMAGVRFLLAGAALYVWMRLRGAARPTSREWSQSAIAGTLLLVTGNGAVVWAEQTVPTGIASLLVATVPLWIVLLDWARPAGTRPSTTALAGIALGLAGLMLLVGPGILRGHGVVATHGALALLLAALSWAVGSLYSRSTTPASSPLLATAMQMLAAGALLLAVGALAGESAALHVHAITLRSAAALLYLITFGSLVGYTAYIWLLGVSTPAKVSTYAYVNPVVAVLLGWMLAGESLTSRTLVAAAVIVGAVALITIGRQTRTGSATITGRRRHSPHADDQFDRSHTVHAPSLISEGDG
jgi:drug/metabolite transporter (DMT)-like permease